MASGYSFSPESAHCSVKRVHLQKKTRAVEEKRSRSYSFPPFTSPHILRGAEAHECVAQLVEQRTFNP